MRVLTKINIVYILLDPGVKIWSRRTKSMIVSLRSARTNFILFQGTEKVEFNTDR